MCLVPIANELARSSLQPVRRENGGRRGRIGLRLTILMLAVLLFPFQVAFGIVPSTQTVDNPVIDFNAVVQMDGFPGTSKPGGGVNGPNGRGVGTGSIVMKFLGQNGVNYYVCVLTADHVVSEPELSGSLCPMTPTPSASAIASAAGSWGSLQRVQNRRLGSRRCYIRGYGQHWHLRKRISRWSLSISETTPTPQHRARPDV